MEQVTRLDIERDGLNQPAPLASARPEAEQRNKEYQAHLERMEVDQEYRMKWEAREKEFEEAKARGYEHI